jgi:O-antigen/teichoic acid export membrane protein
MSSAPIDASEPMRQAVAPQHGLRAVVQSVGSKSAILALQAGTGVLTARSLGPAGRGELAAMILWPLFVASVTTLGVPSALIYYMRNRFDERQRLAANGFATSAAMGVVAGAVAAAVLPLWLRQYSPTLIHTAQLFLLTVPLCSMTLAGRAVLEAAHDFGASNTVQLLTPLVTLLALFFFLAVHRLNPYTAAISYIFAALPSFGLMLYRVVRIGFRAVRPQIADVKQILTYGIRSYGIDILGTLALQVDQVLVVSLLSADAMGYYVVMLSLSRMLNVFQNSVAMVLFPKAAGHTADRVLSMTGKCVRISGLITVISGALICITGRVLLRTVYGPEYVTAAAVLRILVLEAVLSGITFVLAQTFMALNRPGVVTVLQGLGLSLSVPMMLCLIPRYGIYGAAISLLASTSARLLFVCAGFRIFLKVSPPRLLPDSSDMQTLLSARSLLARGRAA